MEKFNADCVPGKGSDFAREYAEVTTKPSGRAGNWTQFDMNTFLVSWSFQLTGGHREISIGFRSGVVACFDSNPKCNGLLVNADTFKLSNRARPLPSAWTCRG
jgi:hypothetical protein